MKMRRLSPTFLLKAGIAVLLFFSGMLLMATRLESDESIKARHQEEKLREAFRRNIKGHHIPPKVPPLMQHVPPEEADAPEAGHARSDTNLAPEIVQVMKHGVKGNYEPESRTPSNSPGENGVPVHIRPDEHAKHEQSKGEYGFSMVVSDKIAMDRIVPDTRPQECQNWEYTTKLPTASVVVVFHNEGFSTLMRTVHSIINMSPKELLHEVVLVDDFSTKTHLAKPLEEYIDKHFNGLVKLHRNTKREGLITTRTLGAKYSSGDVVVFLDAHCECNRNWLVPLLARIRKDRRTLAVPVVDGIDWDTWEYRSTYGHGQLFTGIFEWGFLYKETSLPNRERKKQSSISEPYASPTHAGGLFAINREYFFELGAYDPGLQIWGGENFELSFKIWQCGGRVEWVPCSHVGHVYRTHMPYSLGKNDQRVSLIDQNYLRVIKVWFDAKHTEYFYTRQPQLRGFDVGDTSSQDKLRDSLSCKSFSWFMDEVGYQVLHDFPAPPPNVAWGSIHLASDPGRCWDKGPSDTGNNVKLGYCGGQIFRLNSDGQIAIGERCILEMRGLLHTSVCPRIPTGSFSYDSTTHHLKHNGRCVTGLSQGSELTLASCVDGESSQLWKFKEIYTWK